MGMNALLSHQSRTKPPSPQPWHYVVFHNVHFWNDGGMGKGFPVECHEGTDACFYIFNKNIFEWSEVKILVLLFLPS